MNGKSWERWPEQLQVLDECCPLVAEGKMTWEETAALVSAKGPPRSANACQLRWGRRGGVPQPERVGSDKLAEELLVAQASLKLDRLVWEQERHMVMNEATRLRKENMRLMALNNVVIETFKEAVLRMPTFEVRSWEVRPPGRDQSHVDHPP